MERYRKLVATLIERKITIATAESCTGGLIAKLITDIPGCSAIFLGGVVSYSNTLKSKWLGVSEAILAQFGAVSEPVVDQMLDGILEATGAAAGIAVSGIAGPDGGTPEKPVGTVFIGVACCEQRIIERCLFRGSREVVRFKAAEKAAAMIEAALIHPN